jgi:hypothetical protein
MSVKINNTTKTILEIAANAKGVYELYFED